MASSFLLAIISPEETRAKQPSMPPNGIVEDSPITDRAQPKRVLENAAERTQEPAAVQLTPVSGDREALQEAEGGTLVDRHGLKCIHWF